ncbi:zinc finger BED domain-containing protein RICESLEEPER 2-like [Hordeum vulgare]|nr:zinc finger BED domain-containing protein RICESLEEPER 2-like [Hordeum vulgare]
MREMVKGKGAAGKEKENGKAKSVNYLIRQDSPLPPPVPRKGKHKARIRKAKEFPNAPIGEFICSIKKHLRLLRVSPIAPVPVLHDEEKEEDAEDEDAEDEDAEDEDKEYDEHNLFVVPPFQGGGDMSDDDTSDGYKESADELEDAYWSSLKPVMVEALVCAASYIKGAHVDLNMVPRDENEEDDVETIKLPVVEEIND